MAPIIKFENVSKTFGTIISRARVISLRDISLTINKGERVCLFGPNGAGKSTVMKAIMGLVNPSKGKVFVNNINVQKNPLKIKEMIGYLPSELNFYKAVPCKESLYHFGILRGLSHQQAKKEVERLLKMIGLIKWGDLPPKMMSSGMRQRFSLALALIGDPDIILFDEPVSFIDLQGQMKIFQLVNEYVEENQEKTIIMCTHNIQQAMIMSDRLVLLDRGEIIIDGPIEEVVSQKCKYMQIILSEDAPAQEIMKTIIGDEKYEISGRKILIRSDNALQISVDIINRLQANNISIFSYRPLLEQKRTSTKNDKNNVKEEE
ncbi:MAG: ATP-binding cassette domain-containing protein [Candidatus Heimdallarchaeota archaeon]|nr:ATP-binding cassette domain-containing protein [Candidatus Heimdallarchaeota archaeon]